MDLTACQPIWVMLCRHELWKKTMEKRVKNITPSVDPNLNIVRFKVCVGDLTNSNVLIIYAVGTLLSDHHQYRDKLVVIKGRTDKRILRLLMFP